MTELHPTQATALGAARMRAAHLLVDGEPKIFTDPLALALAGMTADELVETQPRYPTSMWVVRSRYTEDRLARAHGRGVTQYVILGAGLDTFAHRRPDALAAVEVFEVDEPTMQAWKLGRLAELGVAPPASLTYVPCDFETTGVGTALAAHGLDDTRPVFISWLGVSQYLTMEAIGETLAWVASLAPGTSIVFTYCPPEAETDLAVQFARSQGATFDTFIVPGEVELMLADRGLSITDNPSVEDLHRRYFSGRTDALRASSTERLVEACIV